MVEMQKKEKTNTSIHAMSIRRENLVKDVEIALRDTSKYNILT